MAKGNIRKNPNLAESYFIKIKNLEMYFQLKKRNKINNKIGETKNG